MQNCGSFETFSLTCNKITKPIQLALKNFNNN